MQFEGKYKHGMSFMQHVSKVYTWNICSKDVPNI